MRTQMTLALDSVFVSVVSASPSYDWQSVKNPLKRRGPELHGESDRSDSHEIQNDQKALGFYIDVRFTNSRHVER